MYVYNRNTGLNDFRFYLDLNRNGRFETNGYIAEFDSAGFTNGAYGFYTGDPEWVGVLERPDQPHGPNNHFVARYAFLAQPIGNSLDLNYIYNQAATRTVNPASAGNDGYMRNQGVGSWELNLAGFLADLNTNIWSPLPLPDNIYYAFNEPNGFNFGRSFDDARALLSYRYNYLFNNLATAGQLFPNANNVFRFDNIDAYSDGALQLTTTNIIESSQQDPFGASWSGAENPNRFYSLPADLADAGHSSPAFVNRLYSTGTSNATYDRYTFYRMLDQLGTDSSADEGKLNVNYSNAVVQYNGNGSVTSIGIVPGAETNQVPWRPLDFFTAAADRLLRYHTAQWRAQNFADYTNTFGSVTTTAFGLTNIPVYVEGRFVYSPAVNRLLQLAANIYDASTNKAAALGKDYPSVFRPIFSAVVVNGFRDVYIIGFREVTGVSGINDSQLVAPLDVTALPNGISLNDNVYGVPWIIGAKKGFPNFNQFYMRNSVQVTRKLEVTRKDGQLPGATGTNQLFVMSITNRLGFSFWNSYSNSYVSANGMSVYVRDILSMVLTNAGNSWSSFYANPAIVQFATNFTFGAGTPWPGSAWAVGSAPQNEVPSPQSFVSGFWDFGFLPESDFQAAANNFVTVGNGAWDTNFVGGAVPAFPQFGLMTTNRLQAFILDGPYIIDYVQLGGPVSARNISDEIQDKTSNPTDNTQIIAGTAMWVTNGYNNAATPTRGVANQINVSKFGPEMVSAFWRRPPNMPAALNTPTLEASFFKGFFYGNATVYKGKTYLNTNLVIQAPYTPTRTAWEYVSWQANDPLVHHLASDLNTITKLTGVHHADVLANSDYPNPNMNAVGERYQPWGRDQQMGQVNGVDKNPYNFGYRDSLVWNSDHWDFPGNKYPGIGWLGRVHRGTPWQTISLKATNILQAVVAFGNNAPANVGTNTWAHWTGDTQAIIRGNILDYYDAANSAPVHDSDLFDLFTARLNDNAVHGTLSVNQTHLAAWSAVLSGLVVLTNITELPASYLSPVVTNFIVQPAGLAGAGSPIGQIVASIKKTRDSMTRTPAGTFTHLGDILRTPALTEQSPFLNRSDLDHVNYDISDELYEWLPQQTLGLLRANSSPRYVIYCYGQTLRPAPGGTVLSGSLFNLVTNYQVTAESAVRAVIRVDDATTPTPKVTVESYNVLPPD